MLQLQCWYRKKNDGGGPGSGSEGIGGARGREASAAAGASSVHRIHKGRLHYSPTGPISILKNFKIFLPNF